MSAQPRAFRPSRVYTGVETEARLQQLGIREGSRGLVDALQDGAAAARSTTRLHPPVYGGVRMWAEGTASLRSYLADDGWEPLRYFGVDLVVHPGRAIALLMTAGDAAAGNPDYAHPQVRYERRIVIQGLVNGRERDLFDQEEPPVWEVWFLLHHLSATSVRAELSRPQFVTEDGRVGHWPERVIIPGFNFRDPASEQVPLDSTPPDVDVDVRRRAG